VQNSVPLIHYTNELFELHIVHNSLLSVLLILYIINMNKNLYFEVGILV
jgi:hypothetical protein